MKLSKTMQTVMDNMENAEHYYKPEGCTSTGGITFHGSKGDYRIGNQRAWIFADGSYGLVENTKTLEALEKRGLIKIKRAGGNCVDSVEVIGKKPHEPLKTAVKLNVTRTDKNPRYGSVKLVEYMDSTVTTAEQVQAMYNEKMPGFEWEVVEVGTVALTVWDINE